MSQSGRTDYVAQAAARGAVLAVSKPAGPTSHDVVARVRRAFGTRQVGHTGTLDPFATGLLLVCIGPATRLAEYLTSLPKTYLATLRLGETTETDDLEGEVLYRSDAWRTLNPETVHEALTAQVGSFEQLPPLFSAKRVGGERSYARARRGEAVERRAVPVVIHSITVQEIRLPDITFEVECGSGTYIRAIARDVGEALSTGAHLRSLRRSRIGFHDVDRAVELEQVDDPAACSGALLDPVAALSHLPRLQVSDAEAEAIRMGRRISLAEGFAAETPIVVTQGTNLLAIGECTGAELQPRKVFA